jgi:dihydroflavonol-4-reductase
MTTLVTGATGFVGSAVVRHLLRAGHHVRVFVRPNSDRRNLEGLGVDPIVGDLLDRVSVDRAVQGCNAVFHVAADYRLWVPDPQKLYETNVTGTRNMMLAALHGGVERIVYTSSVAALGLRSDRTPADETTPVSLNDMIGHYKRSKFLAEAEVQALVAQHNLPAVIVNPSTPVGPRDIKPTPTGRMIADAVRGRLPAFVDTGLNLVHVDDVAAGHQLAFERGVIGQRYILGAENLSLAEMLGEIATITGRRPPRIRLPHNLVLPVAFLAEGWARVRRTRQPLVTVSGVQLAKKHMYFSHQKAARELGFNPRPGDAALRDAVAWFNTEDYSR